MMSIPESAGHTLKNEVVSVSNNSYYRVNRITFVKIRANGPSGWRFILKTFLMYVGLAAFRLCIISMTEIG